MADLQDPKFWGVVLVMWLFCIVVVWKLTLTGTWLTTNLKIFMSIVLGPLVFGTVYLTLRD